MTITADTLISRYPHLFDGESIEIINEQIAEAYQDLPIDRWTDPVKRDRAASLIATHKRRLEIGDILKLSGNQKSIDENEDFNVDTINDALPYWKQTIYGTEFEKLKKRLFGGGIFVV